MVLWQKFQINFLELENIIKHRDDQIEELKNQISNMLPKEVLVEKDEEIKILTEKVYENFRS